MSANFNFLLGSLVAHSASCTLWNIYFNYWMLFVSLQAVFLEIIMEVDKKSQKGRGFKDPMDTDEQGGDFESLPADRGTGPGPAKCE